MIPKMYSDESEFEQICEEQTLSCAGKELCGTTRTIHEVSGNPDLIVKKAKNSTLPNWTEHLMYMWCGKLSNRLPLAKVESISKTGKYLVMERLCTDSPTSIPKYGPPWLGDRKPDAFRTDRRGNLKVCDYATVNLGPYIGTQQYLDESKETRPLRLCEASDDACYAHLCGDCINADDHRDVYKCNVDETRVVKVATASCLENVIEWIIYESLREIHATELIFFPAFEISASGRHVVTENLIDWNSVASAGSLGIPPWLMSSVDTLRTNGTRGCKFESWSGADLAAVLSRVGDVRYR